MPIDPTIALGVKPMQFEDPVAKTISLRGMLQGQELHAEQLKAAQAANDKNALAAKDQELARQAWKENPTDPNAMLKRAKELGVGPDYITSLEKHFTDVRKTNAEIDDKELQVRKYQNEQLAGLTSKALQIPDDQYAQAWPQLRQAAMQINPKLQLPDQPLSKEDLDHFRLVFTTEGSLLSEAEEKRKQAGETRAAAGEQRAAALAPSQLSEAQSRAATAGMDVAGRTIDQVTDQAGYDAYRQSLNPEVAKRLPTVFNQATKELVKRMAIPVATQVAEAGQAAARTETARHNQVEESQGAGRLAVSRNEQALRQKTFDATYGALVDPTTGKAMDPEAAKAVASQDPLASAIANYQGAPPNVGTRGGAGASIMRKVLAINPNYNAQNWQAQGKLLNDFTSGSSSKELVAINTALGHVGVLNEAVEALKNGDIRVLNSIANRFGLETGSTPAAVFKTITHRVGPELVKAYSGSGGGVEEREVAAKDFDPNLPPQTLHANVAMTARLLDSKIEAKKSQYKNVMGDRQFNFLTPEAESTMQKLKGGTASAAGGHVIELNGKQYTYKGTGATDDLKNYTEVKK